MRDLQDSRKEIDIIDEQIIRLFEKRMDICKDVAAYKLHTGKPVLDRKRELDKLKTLKAQASNKFYGHGVEELFEQIMSMSRKMQYKLLTEEGVNSDIGFDIVDDLPKEDVTVAYREYRDRTASRLLRNILVISQVMLTCRLSERL